jgi:hypothetical protein
MFDLISRLRSWTAGDDEPARAALLAEAWEQIVLLADVVEAQTRALEVGAGRLRAIGLYLRAAQGKRNASLAEQIVAFEGLRAAIVEANADAGALSFDATLDKFLLALTSTPGQES